MVHGKKEADRLLFLCTMGTGGTYEKIGRTESGG